MSDYLKNESSLYLKEYSNTSICWYPWGDKALTRAKKEQKPIFVSLGYSGSYWCEVMKEESFIDETIIQLLNEHFISIKVDKDERTDLDKYFKQIYRLMNGQDCASPISVFLTENLEPFYTAAYIAPKPRGNVLGFEKLLYVIKTKYHDDKITMQQKGQEVLEYLNPKKRVIEATRLNINVTTTIGLHAKELFDNEHGGFTGEPKFLHTSTLDLLLDTYEFTKDQTLLTLVEKTLINIHGSDVHDNHNGGFYRYANQKDWTLPREEKTSYDNAMLISLYLRLFTLTQNTLYKNIALETVEFMLSEMYGDSLFYANSVVKKDGMYMVDTKAITSFNAMVITALLSISELSTDYLDVALTSLNTLIGKHFHANMLYHTDQTEGFLEDYSFLGIALLQAYRLTEEQQYLSLAETIAHQMIDKFYEYGFWKFSNSNIEVYDDIYDPLYPSAMATAVSFLYQLSFFVDSDYNQFVFKTLELNSYKLMRQPLSSPTMSRVLLQYLKKML